MSADDGLAKENSAAGHNGKPGPPPSARTAAAEWLRDRLTGGPMPVGDPDKPEAGTIRAEAKEAGLSWSAVRRGSEELGIKSERCPHTKKYQWRLSKPA